MGDEERERNLWISRHRRELNLLALLNLRWYWLCNIRRIANPARISHPEPLYRGETLTCRLDLTPNRLF